MRTQIIERLSNLQGLDNRDWAAMAPDVFDAEDMYPNAQEAILDDLTAITDTMSAASIRQNKKKYRTNDSRAIYSAGLEIFGTNLARFLLVIRERLVF